MSAVVVPYDEAIAGAGRAIAESVQRQNERPAREAAVAALGRHATEQQVVEWIARHRPASQVPAVSA